MSRKRNTIKNVYLRDLEKELEMRLLVLDNKFETKMRVINNMFEAYIRGIPPSLGNSIPVPDEPDICVVDESVENKECLVDELPNDNSEKNEENTVVNETDAVVQLVTSQVSGWTNSSKSIRVGSPLVTNLGCLNSVPEDASMSGSWRVPTSKQMGPQKFKTPALRTLFNQPAVTPKVCMNTPLSFLRRPKQGEVALSMAGSPLLVSSTTSDQMANVNIPLMDGRVVSILPKPNLQPYELPHLDPCTRAQLTTLQEHLATVLEMSREADTARSNRH